MNVITHKRIRDFIPKHPGAGTPLDQWYRAARKARWESLHEVRVIYPLAHVVSVASRNIVTVFNIGGSEYRLIAAIHYNTQRVYVLKLLTHAEHDRDLWKDTR